MIVSFHPLYEGDVNLLCAGREPDDRDAAAVRGADIVILPQGCRRSLYEMAKTLCGKVFPNYDARFQYSGKIGQHRLFQKIGAPHPRTVAFSDWMDFCRQYPIFSETTMPFSFPFIVKFDWGGEGMTVYRVDSVRCVEKIAETIKRFEGTGQKGFLFQEFIPSGNQTLRVVVIGKTLISYWKVQNRREGFKANIHQQASIDFHSAPELIAKGEAAVRVFCRQTGIDLAGIDILFSGDRKRTPLFLEINYFFGRKGLGGSARYYEILMDEIRKWVENQNISGRVKPDRTVPYFDAGRPR